jgi:hypothetical protein
MRRYSVSSTDQFDETWQRAVCDGVIDAEVGEGRLEALASFLAVYPKYFAHSMLLAKVWTFVGYTSSQPIFSGWKFGTQWWRMT